VDRVNHQFRLASRPFGMATRDNFERTEEPAGEPADGEVLVEVQYISLDPAMRGWMNDVRSYVPPIAIGDVMRAGGAGRVVASAHPDFAEGDHVTGVLGVQEYAVAPGRGLTKADTDLAPLPVHLATLGMPGLTAYFGLLDVGEMKSGDTVVVSGAAGAVGSVAGQIAKIKGCRAVGIVGGPVKCRYVVDDLGFDAAIDYKSEDVRAGLREHCPDGVNVYFDNVGGAILEAALARLARGGRIVISGAVSQYNSTEPVHGPANYLSLLVNRGSMRGFLVFDYADRYAQAHEALAGWLREGRLTSRVDVVEGFDAFPDALTMLFTGQNLGKLVLHVAGG
jgi:NADPH-dependent curcumin reductase CurA